MEEAKRKQLLEALEEMKKQLLGLSKEKWISTIRKQRNQRATSLAPSRATPR